MAKVTIDTKEQFFVNPFHFGINYDMFLDALKGKTVKEYCKSNLTDEKIEWLENDLKHYEENKKNK